MSDLNFDVRDADEGSQVIGSTRGKTSKYEPVAQKWLKIDKSEECIVLSDLSMNDVQNIRNLLYNRFGKEDVIVRSSKDGEIEGETVYKAVVREREDGEFLRSNGEDSDDESATMSEDNPFDDLEPDTPNATSAAVDLAAEHGVDLGSIDGTGKDGKILKSDVEELV